MDVRYILSTLITEIENEFLFCTQEHKVGHQTFRGIPSEEGRLMLERIKLVNKDLRELVASHTNKLTTNEKCALRAFSDKCLDFNSACDSFLDIINYEEAWLDLLLEYTPEIRELCENAQNKIEEHFKAPDLNLELSKKELSQIITSRAADEIMEDWREARSNIENENLPSAINMCGRIIEWYLKELVKAWLPEKFDEKSAGNALLNLLKKIESPEDKTKYISDLKPIWNLITEYRNAQGSHANPRCATKNSTLYVMLLTREAITRQSPI